MATGLIGDKTGSQPRAPRPPQRARPAGRPGLAERPVGRPEAAQRPAGRTGVTDRPGRPGVAERPGRPGVTERPRVTERPGPQRAAGTRATGASRGRPRTPFVLLLIGLLGGGLVCLLLINTTLAQGAFQIQAMQQKNSSLTQQVQALEQQTRQQESPVSIAARAQQLGMQPVGRLRFIDLTKERIYSQPRRVADVPFAVPGYTP